MAALEEVDEKTKRAVDHLMKLAKDCNKFGILVIGETGVGKSTLINNLLGKDVAPVGDDTESMTPTIADYPGEVNGMPVMLYDTPGLEDSRSGADEQHLQKIGDLLSTGAIHIIVYCIKMTESRMRASFIRTFQEYTKIGIDWKIVVFALTFADALPYPRSARSDPNQKAKYFIKRTKEWNENIVITLTTKVGIDAQVLESIQAYPSTSDPEEELPTGKLWYIPLWLGVLSVLSPEAASAFIGIHHKMIVDDEEQQPLAAEGPIADVPLSTREAYYVSPTQSRPLNVHFNEMDKHKLEEIVKSFVSGVLGATVSFSKLLFAYAKRWKSEYK